MRTRVKVCCIANIEEARMAVDAGADALGLVAEMPSGPGPISDAEIQQIVPQIPPPISTFLLTSRTRAEDIAEHVALIGPSTVQIVSHISAKESQRLAQLIPNVQRVQVIHVENESALDLIPMYAPYVHAFLLDSGRPSAETVELGGTGRTHDWAISAAFVAASPLPVILAGGLNDENVESAIAKVKPFAVDLCSGVRTVGQLDQEKLIRFMTAVRRRAN